jgi:hypothetical protein
MENHEHQPTAFEQEQVVSEPTEIERIQKRVSDFTVGLRPATAEAALASMSMLLEKGLIKVADLDAVISIREEINKGLIEYKTTVEVATKQMERAQQNLIIEQEQERQRVLAQMETKIVDERQLRKSTQDQLESNQNRLSQMEAVLKSHGINMDLDGDGVVGLKQGQVADTLTATEQAEVDSIVHHGYDANGSPTTETPTAPTQTSGAFKLARMMNPIEQGANGTTAEDMTPSVSETMQAELEPITTEHDESDDLEAAKRVEEDEYYAPSQATFTPQGTTTESFLDEVARVDEVANADDWEDPIVESGGTLDIGYEDNPSDIDSQYEDMDTGEQEGKDIYSGNTEIFKDVPQSETTSTIEAAIPQPQSVSAPLITGGNAPSITKEHLADGVYVETEEVPEVGDNDVVISQDNIRSFANEEDLLTETEEEYEEVVIPNRKDLEGMTKKQILSSAGNLSFEIDSKLNKNIMIDTFETQANALIEELTGGDEFESISEETVDGDDDRRDGGYF